jgi:hypothetical protein
MPPELPGIGIGEVAEADEPDIVARPLLGAGAVFATHLEAEGDVAEHRQPGQQPRLLEDHGAVGADAMHRFAVDRHPAAIGHFETGQHAQQRGLARSRRADDDKAFAGADVEVQALQHRQRSAVDGEGFREVANRNLAAAAAVDAGHAFSPMSLARPFQAQFELASALGWTAGRRP